MSTRRTGFTRSVSVAERALRDLSLLEVQEVAKALAKGAKPGDVIVLTGELGAGKTTFSKAFGEGLSCPEVVSSPTFTLVNEYYGRLPLYHFDTYRLTDAGDVWDLGFDEYFFGDGVCLLEWGERIAEVLPEDRLEISFEKVDEDHRSLFLRSLGPNSGELLESLEVRP